MTGGRKRRGEFQIIADLFAPLTKGEAGAFALTDDAAALKPKPGHDIVLTTDAVVAGVHFLPDDPPATIAQKALRVNLSDLAAKGATLRAYMLTAAFPDTIDDVWLKAFATGLKRDQTHFGITLIGGDTVATPGPLLLNVVALGEVAHGHMLRRMGAKVGDDVWVSGTIGDAGLGLRVLKGDGMDLGDKHRAALIARYRIPQPRVAVGQGLLKIAHACLDVSDGLVADLGHIATASGVSVEIASDAFHVPQEFQDTARALNADPLAWLLTGGDDHALVATFPPDVDLPMAWSVVGRVVEGKGVLVDGQPYDGPGGWQSFA
jgi:thiamine-monophosphate kinase